MQYRTVLIAGVLVSALISAELAIGSPQVQPPPPKPAAEKTPPAAPGAAETDKTSKTSKTLPASAVAAAPADKRLATLDARARGVLATQVALDRAGFSSGQIDGGPGGNTDRALSAFQQSKGLPPGALNAQTITALGDSFATPVVDYAITAADADGPFVAKIPADMMEKSKLPALGYASVLELLAERFHASPKLLQRLNPQTKFASGETIIVPNVEPFMGPGTKAARPAPTAATAKPPATDAATPSTPGGAPAKPDATPPVAAKTAKPSTGGNVVMVTERAKSLTVQNAAGETIFHAPVTVGSKNDPLPVGEWKINGVSNNPTFNYNPALFWDANPAHAKAKIPAGPNSPVGVVWIDLSKEHYGIHGTPEPGRIGYTESHGCIRLTNWDAVRLSALVGPGTKVILK